MLTWPPQLQDLKDEKKIPRTDTRDDARFQRHLDAACERVADLRAGEFDFSGAEYVPPTPIELADPDFIPPLKPPGERIINGTILLASRWANRANTPDGVVDAGDAGVIRIASIDPDIEAMLGVGRHRKPMC